MLTLLDDALHLARVLLKRLLLATVWDGVLFNLGRVALLASTLGHDPGGATLEHRAGRI